MSSSDFLYVLHWYVILFIVGLAFLPLTITLFSQFIDRGYLFSKILGTLFLSYILFLGGIVHIFAFTQTTTILALGVLGLMNTAVFLIKTKRNFLKTCFLTLQSHWKLFLFEELLFFASLLFWSYVRSFQPDIDGLEKYMDFGFVNSIVRADYFPPRDMWFTPFSINYYYFGHLYTAVLTKLSGIPSFITYNLMIATLFAFTFSLSFSIGLNLFNTFLATTESQKKREEQKNSFRVSKIFSVSVVAGLLTAFLVACAGNLHTIYAFLKPYNVESPQPFYKLPFFLHTFPNSYWYPNATRFIYNTIHEFPLYSFVVSDLHGHVSSIPIVLTIIALLFQQFLSKNFKHTTLTLLSFLLAVAYMTNAWDGIIYFLLASLTLLYITFKPNEHLSKVKHKIVDFLYFILVLFVGFLLFSFPFSLNFKPFVSGIGVLCAPTFLTDRGSIGRFLFEANHCQKSPFWQLVVLYGFFYFWVVSFILFLFKKRHVMKTDVFVIFLILLSTLLIILPEFVYVKDIYPAHYRANTMFKLVYQAFIMLSLSSGYIIIRLISNLKFQISNFKTYWKVLTSGVGIILLALVSLYPYFAVNSYYGDLKTYHGLDGTLYLKSLYPSDYQAIQWINTHIKGQPVILEAQGDSYTHYARISANTGLPTVLGWTVHEWLWRGTYDIPAPRITDVQTLYETNDLLVAKKLIKTYHITYVFVGPLEHEKYPHVSEEKFKSLGKEIYHSGQSTIYQIL